MRWCYAWLNPRYPEIWEPRDVWSPETVVEQWRADCRRRDWSMVADEPNLFIAMFLKKDDGLPEGGILFVWNDKL